MTHVVRLLASGALRAPIARTALRRSMTGLQRRRSGALRCTHSEHAESTASQETDH